MLAMLPTVDDFASVSQIKLILLYLSDDVVSAPLPPHLAPGVLRCSAIANRSVGVFVFFGRTPSSFVTNNEPLQQTSAHSCSSGWDCGHPFPPSLPLSQLFLYLRILHKPLLFERTTDGTFARSRNRSRRSRRFQRAPIRANYPHFPCVP